MVSPIPTMPVKVSRIQHRRGTQAEFNAMYPPGYTGRGGVEGWDVLQAGEMALCTDSRRVFMGLPNGEYTEITTKVMFGTDLQLTPLHIQLRPSTVYRTIHELTHDATPYFVLEYSLSDSYTNTHSGELFVHNCADRRGSNTSAR